MTRIAKDGENQFNFTTGDSIVNQANANNQIMHGHVLVYHNALPEWLETANYSEQEMLEFLETYTRTVVQHYKGRIDIWDVTNELWDPDTGEWKNKLFYNTLGENYPKDVFQWAHEEDPDAELILNGNEYQLPGPARDTALYYIQKWKNEGVPIDGIGFQAHIRLDQFEALGYDQTLQGFKDSMKKFADLGLRIHITELDIAIDLPVTQEKLERQAELYHDIVKACLQQPNCVEINTWGFIDKYSWINEHEIYEGKYAQGLPFDDQYQPKLAYYAIKDAFEEK